MVAEIVMAQVDGATQAAQLAALAGNTYTVGNVSTSGQGLGSWLFLTPDGGAGSTVALKLESARQVTELSALVGKSVTVAKAPVVTGSTVGKWLVLKPLAGGTVKAAAAGSSLSLLQLEGAKQGLHASSLVGKTFTVINPPMLGKGASKWLFLQPVGGGDIVALKTADAASATSFLGKTVTVGKAPLMAGDPGTTWLALKPVASATATKATASGSALAKAAALTKPAVGLSKIAVGSGKAIVGATAVKTVAAGTIWTGTGLSLGLGLGLGAWGPALLAGVVGLAGYGYYRNRRARAEGDDMIEAINEATG
ncbi:MAG: hypothetical protein H7841_09190 [Magnetospirillum sp. WYHS-4]